MDNNDKLKDLEKRIKYLESKLKILANDPNAPKVSKPKNKKENNSENNNKAAKKYLPKYECVLNQNLNAVDKDDDSIVFELNDEDLVKNNVCMGDDVIVETNKDGTIKALKVAQRTKRSYVEALVTEKNDSFYAVSEHATHKLLDYDVKTNGVLKGFEVVLILPNGKEKNAVVSIIKEVTSATKHFEDVPKIHSQEQDYLQQYPNTPDAIPVQNETPKDVKKLHDPRVLEDDDLV